MKRKIWIAVLDDIRKIDIAWMVEADLSKPLRFVELKDGRIGFTQVEHKWWKFWK